MEGLGGHDMTERIVLKGLVDDLRRLIVEARQDVARTVFVTIGMESLH